jgi:SAM-dependent methyltransferase
MDYTNLGLLKGFSRRYFKSRRMDNLTILDVGSKDEMKGHKDMVFRKYFNVPAWKYIGVDIVPGVNVDIILDDPYNYPFEDSFFNLVICASVLEHETNPIRLIRELLRVTKEYLVIIVPWNRPKHEYPLDYWRMSPEALEHFVTEFGNFKKIDSGTIKRDSYIIAQKIRR